MELALPHVIVRVCRPGLGNDLVAALGVHPIEVSEARDSPELRRVAEGRPAFIVVVVDPPDPHAVASESWDALPGVPLLIVSDAEPYAPGRPARSGWVDTIPSSQPLEAVCWCVLDAVSRATLRPDLAEHPFTPQRIEVDAEGVVVAASTAATPTLSPFVRLRPGDSLPAHVDPFERPLVAHAIAQLPPGETLFRVIRLIDDQGLPHAVSLGLRKSGDGRALVLVQPLLDSDTSIGRRVSPRDPITGLLTRWAMSRALESPEVRDPFSPARVLVLVSLDDFEPISHYIGHRKTDDVLLAVASAMNRMFPHPALTSRLMGDTFLACVDGAGVTTAHRRAERLLRFLDRIKVPGFAPPFALRASIGVADIEGGDSDLALRLAQVAAAEAHAAGGDRVLTAGRGSLSTAQSAELTASMDLGSWEVWLQPVMRAGSGGIAYHEALARFDAARPLASRADFFIAGRADGLLERFDRMMLLRVLEILESHEQARISVNVSFETFVSRDFPASFLDPIGRLPDGCHRFIIEIASRCVAAPAELVRARLESLAAAGVAVAIDDFGSGLCRMNALTQWPIAMVKLDELVTGYIDDDPLQRDFVRIVTGMCRARGITTVAEYTRSPDQLARLIDDGVDLFQGELFGMPRPAADALAAPAEAAVPPGAPVGHTG